MDSTLWLIAYVVLGIVTLGLCALFVAFCDRV